MLAQATESGPGKYSGFIIKRFAFENWLNVFKAQLFPYDTGQVTSLILSVIICKKKGTVKKMVVRSTPQGSYEG